MYNKDNVIKKIAQAKRDLIIKNITKLNEKVIKDNIKLNSDFGKHKKIYISYFDKKEDDLVESILQNDDDIEHIVSSCLNYYKKFASMFKFYLDKTVLTHYISNLNDTIVNLNLTRRIISVPFDEWVRNNQFFDDFSRMIKTLEDIGLSNNDQFSIVMETIWKNMNTDLLNVDSNCSINFFSMASGEINGFNDEEVIEIITEDKYSYLLEKRDNELSDLELRQKKVLIASKEIFELKKDFNIKKFQDKYSILKEYYFDKLDENGKPANLSDSDVNIIVNTLEELGVTDRFLKLSSKILKKFVVKENKPYNFVNIDNHKTNKLINEKEYKEIRREIKKYFNMHSGQIERQLSEEEVLYCASLMLKIGEKELVKTLFDRSKTYDDNPVSRYQKEYDKLKYYENRLGIEKEISDMEFAFQNMFLSSEEDYEILKSILDSDLRKVESLLPSGYEYEIKKAKEYKKVK